MISERIVV